MSLDSEEPVLVKRGTLIHAEKPFVHVLHPQFRYLRCDHCYSKINLSSCSRCDYVKFCDETCMKNGRRSHIAECSYLSKYPARRECSFVRNLPSPRDWSHESRLMLKIITKLKYGGGAAVGYYDNESSQRSFNDLISNDVKMKQKLHHMEKATAIFKDLKEFLGTENLPDYPEFFSTYCRMITNRFEILDDQMNAIGTGIYIGASTIDHSCRPNAVAVFEGTTMFIRTIAAIPKYDWSKLRISYVDCLSNRKDRQSALWSNYCFRCDCDRCIEEDNVETAAICQNCSNIIYVDQSFVPSKINPQTNPHWVPPGLAPEKKKNSSSLLLDGNRLKLVGYPVTTPEGNNPNPEKDLPKRPYCSYQESCEYSLRLRNILFPTVEQVYPHLGPSSSLSLLPLGSNCNGSRPINFNSPDVFKGKIFRRGCIEIKAECEDLTTNETQTSEKKKMVCNSCQWEAPESFIDKYKLTTQFSGYRHQKIIKRPDFESCKDCQQMEHRVLHRDNLLHVTTLELSLGCAIRQKFWDEAICIGLELISSYVKYYGMWHPITGLHHVRVVKMIFNFDRSRMETALKLLTSAEVILRTSHGTIHHVYRELQPLVLQCDKLAESEEFV